MNWYEIAGLIFVGVWVSLGPLVALALGLLIRWYDRADQRHRQVFAQRRSAGVSLPSEYRHRHWVDMER